MLWVASFVLEIYQLKQWTYFWCTSVLSYASLPESRGHLSFFWILGGWSCNDAMEILTFYTLFNQGRHNQSFDWSCDWLKEL